METRIIHNREVYILHGRVERHGLLGLVAAFPYEN